LLAGREEKASKTLRQKV